MNKVLDSADLQRFRLLIAQRYGLNFEEGRKDQLSEVFLQGMARSQCSEPTVFLKRLESNQLSGSEIAPLVRDLTVAETHFFRHWDQFRAVLEVAVPACIQRQSTSQQLSILSAGCASGEEAYSIAILLREKFPLLANWEVRIQGIDINASLLEKARSGRFTDWSLRGLPKDINQRYFTTVGKEHVLRDSIRNQVTFAECNLALANPSFWRSQIFDIILFRNVLIYLTNEAAIGVIDRMSNSLFEEGFLFVGPAETLRGMSHDFHLRHSHEAFYYQRRTAKELAERPQTPIATLPSWNSTAVAEVAAGDVSWVEAIRRASARIERLGRTSNGNAADAASHPDPPSVRPIVARDAKSNETVGAARELVQREQFDEALQMLRGIPAANDKDPDSELLQAVILTNQGLMGEAEKLCHRVLAGDELNAEAHYLLALCREHAGEINQAMEEDLAAIYLDPQFAIPHLHLGIMKKRAGEWKKASEFFRKAKSLLTREDASRIVLFGGGFRREALMQLCVAEDLSCGGAA